MSLPAPLFGFFSPKEIAAVYFPQKSLYANATSVKDNLLLKVQSVSSMDGRKAESLGLNHANSV